MTNISGVVTVSTTTATPAVTYDVKEKLRILMKNLTIGYGYVGCLGIHYLLNEKSSDDLKVLLKPLGKVLSEVFDQDIMNIFTSEVQQRMKVIGIWASIVTVDMLKELTNETLGKFMFANRYPPDIHELLLEFDGMFDPVEGEQLLDVVDQVEKYSAAEHGPVTAEALCKKFAYAMLAPIKRHVGTPKLKSFIAKANRAYQKRYPDFRRSDIFNALVSFVEIESQDLPDTRRRMGKGTKHMKTKYKGIMRHLIKKHPTLFKYFAKHYHRSAKHKHHHSKKRHHTPHHKKHHNNKQRREHHKQNREEFTTTTRNANHQNPPEIYPDGAIEIPNFRESPAPERFSPTFPSFSNTFETFPATFERSSTTFEPFTDTFETFSTTFEPFTETFESFSTTYDPFSTTFKPVSITSGSNPTTFGFTSTTVGPNPTTLTFTSSKQKRFNIVSERTSIASHKYRISPSILTRRGMDNNRSRHDKRDQLFKDISNRLKAHSVSRNAQSTRVLDKIVQESSYSDEEKYLKAMLDDAFFHGNDTITSNWTRRAQVHGMGGDSDTDEEWVFKSNIYKVFQQPISTN